MLEIKLPAAEKKRLAAYTEDLKTAEDALDALEEAGVPAPGLRSELEKVKKMQKVLLERF